MTINMLEAISSGIPPGWEIKQVRLESPSNLSTITPEHPDYDPNIKYCPLHITVMLQKSKPREVTIVETEHERIPDREDLDMWAAVGGKWWRIKEAP